MFKRKPKDKAGAKQPQDFPIVDGKPVKAKTAKPTPAPEPVAAAPEPIAVPEPAKASRPTPESHPHLFDFAGNPL